MNIKQITSIAFISMIALGSYAQDSESTSFGLLGGVNFQNISGEDSEGKDLKNDMIIGFHAGMNFQIPIVPEFYIQPGVLFSTKGAKYSDDNYSATTSLSYIEVPIEFLYKGALGTGNIIVGLGPYFGYAVMGKTKFESDLLNEESDIEFTSTIEENAEPKVYLKAFDAGGNVFAGYEMASGLFFRLNTQLGMLNLQPEDKRLENSEETGIIKNTGFGLSLGYRFI